jgi:hypothetical protein
MIPDAPYVIAIEVPAAAPDSILSNGIHSVVIWWRAFPKYRIEWSPDGFAWFVMSIGQTAHPELPVVLVDNGTGWWWRVKFYRLVEEQ